MEHGIALAFWRWTTSFRLLTRLIERVGLGWLPGHLVLLLALIVTLGTLLAVALAFLKE